MHYSIILYKIIVIIIYTFKYWSNLKSVHWMCLHFVSSIPRPIPPNRWECVKLLDVLGAWNVFFEHAKTHPCTAGLYVNVIIFWENGEKQWTCLDHLPLQHLTRQQYPQTSFTPQQLNFQIYPWLHCQKTTKSPTTTSHNNSDWLTRKVLNRLVHSSRHNLWYLHGLNMETKTISQQKQYVCVSLSPNGHVLILIMNTRFNQERKQLFEEEKNPLFFVRKLSRLVIIRR